MSADRSSGAGQMNVGKYRLLAPIGHGGMADVYLALARGPAGFNKLLVVKQLRAAFVHDPEFLAMFMDEARLAARLNHPNVVQTYEVGHDGDVYFIAMEFLDGQALHRVLRRFNRLGGLPVAVHVRIISEALSGLQHAHELEDFDGTPLQVVHRDVTPQNVFVTYDGQVKLVDFGIAKAMDSVAETRVGMFKGKLAYMSPEQARGERVDRRSDIFSAGVMLWEALAGRRMWKGMSEVEVARQLADGHVPDIADARDDLPEVLLGIVRKATATERDDRYDTALDFQQDLEDYLASIEDRSDTRHVGRTVAEAFDEEREKMRSTIDTQVRPLLEGRGSIRTLDTEGFTFAASTESTERSSVRGDRDPHFAGPEDITARYDTQSGGRGWLLGAVGAVVLIGLGAGGAYLALRSGRGEVAEATVDADDIDGANVAKSAAVGGADCDATDKPLVELSGDIEDDATLSCDKDYLLKFTTFVRPGAALTIEAGTTIKGDRDTKGTLVVQPGGQIFAEGTKDRPIVFTSELPPGQRKPGDWGGLIVMGSAPINLRDAKGRPKQGSVEGLTVGGEYGGNDPNDDSGALRYVRIEYSGIEIGPNNEINGLTLAGVGRGTKIDHVQVRHTADDCFEFFGGTVDASHLVCQHAGDDGFDFEYGYGGRLQYLLFRDDPGHPDASNGIEADNDPDGSKNEPLTAPQIYNATFCGPNRKGKSENYAVLARGGSHVSLHNAIFTGFDAGVDLRDANTELDITNSLFFGNLSHDVAYPESGDSRSGPTRDDDQGRDETALLLDPGLENATTRAQIGDCFDREAPIFKPGEAITQGAATPPDDGFFRTRGAFVGAFENADDDWDAGAWLVWTD